MNITYSYTYIYVIYIYMTDDELKCKIHIFE